MNAFCVVIRKWIYESLYNPRWRDRTSGIIVQIRNMLEVNDQLHLTLWSTKNKGTVFTLVFWQRGLSSCGMVAAWWKGMKVLFKFFKLCRRTGNTCNSRLTPRYATFTWSQMNYWGLLCKPASKLWRYQLVECCKIRRRHTFNPSSCCRVGQWRALAIPVEKVILNECESCEKTKSVHTTLYCISVSTTLTVDKFGKKVS